MTELLSLDRWQWNIMEPYPDVTDIQSSNIISYNQSFYVFGGSFNGTLVTNEILRFKNKTWSRVGNLLSKRVTFSVIKISDKVHIVGELKNEVCSLSVTVTCKQDLSIDYHGFKQPVLFSFNVEPLLKIVDDSCEKMMPNFEQKSTEQLIILSNTTFNEFERLVSTRVETDYRITIESIKHRSISCSVVYRGIFFSYG